MQIVLMRSKQSVGNAFEVQLDNRQWLPGLMILLLGMERMIMNSQSQMHQLHSVHSIFLVQKSGFNICN